MPNPPRWQPNLDIVPQWKIWQSFVIFIIMLFVTLIPALFAEHIKNYFGYLMLSQLLTFACFFLMPMYLVCIYYKQPLQVLGFQAKPLTQGLFTAMLWGVGLYVLNVFCGVLTQVVFPHQAQELHPMMGAILETGSILELGGLVFMLTVVGPVGEELFFRSFLFGAIEAKYGRVAGILLSALAFALVHDPWSYLSIFAGGCGFAVLYAKYRDITLNMIAHATWNSIALIMLFALQ